MRIPVLFVVPALACGAVLLLGGCRAQPPPASPETVVQALYDAFPPEAEPVQYGAEDDLSLYFDTALVRLFAREKACVEETGEICTIDYVVLYDTQDPDVADLQVGPYDAGRGRVGVRFKNAGQPAGVQAEVVETSEGWRVADVVYPEGPSLAERLSQPAAF